MLVRLSGAEAGEADDAFDLVVLLFDGRDEAALAEARGEWRRLKDQGRTISYWRESDEGGWERRGSTRGLLRQFPSLSVFFCPRPLQFCWSGGSAWDPL